MLNIAAELRLGINSVSGYLRADINAKPVLIALDCCKAQHFAGVKPTIG